MSRLNQPNSLNYGNKETHIFTEFGTLNKESTQKEVLQAIKDINISAEIGSITVESSDTITHSKLDTINTNITNKHLSKTTDSVSAEISNVDNINIGETADIINKQALVVASNIYAYNASGPAYETLTFSNASYLNDESVKNRLDTSTIIFDPITNNTAGIYPINSVLLNGTKGLVTNSVLMGTDQHDNTARLIMTDDGILKVENQNNITDYATQTTLANLDGKIHNDTTHPQAVQVEVKNDSIEVTGAVTVNTITDYATQTTLSNLDSKINSDSINTSAIQVQIKNSSLAITGNVGITGNVNIGSLPYITANNNSMEVFGENSLGVQKVIRTNDTGNLDVVGTVSANISGSINNTGFNCNNQISGYNLEASQLDIKNQLNNLQFTTTTKYLKTEIENASLDTHIMGKNGTNYYNIATDTNGKLDVVGSVSITGTPSVNATITPNNDYSTNNTFKTSVYNSNGNAISSTVPITNKIALDTASILYTKTDASTITPITSTTNGTRQELDVNMDKTDVHLYGKKPVSGNAVEIINTDNYNHLTTRLTNDGGTVFNTFDADGGINTHITGGSISNTGFNCNNQISGYNLEASQLDIKNQLNNLQFTTTTKYLKTEIENASLDTHIMGKNGTTYYNVATDTNGKLDVVGSVTITGTPSVNATCSGTVFSKLEDKDGNGITSTLSGSNRSLDVNIASGTISVGTVQIEDTDGYKLSAVSQTVPQLKTTLYNTTGDNIGSTSTTYNTISKIGLNSFVCNGVTTPAIIGGSDYQASPSSKPLKVDSSGTAYVSITNTPTISGTVSLDTTGNTIKISQTGNESRVFLDDAQNNKISLRDGSANNIASINNPLGTANDRFLNTNSLNTGIDRSRNPQVLVQATMSEPTTTASQLGIYALDTNAHLSARDIYNDIYRNVTLKNNGNAEVASYNALETYSRNDKTTNNLSNIGLNMYPIYPKRKIYTIAGLGNTALANMLLSNFGTAVSFSSVSWGKQALKTFYASLTAGGATKYIFFEYVDSNGDLQTTTLKTVSTTSGSTAIITNAIGINRFYFGNLTQGGANNQNFGTSDSMYVSTTSGSITPSYYGGFYYANWNCTYTCPNGKVAVLESFQFYASSAVSLYIFICDVDGGRRIVGNYSSASNYVYNNLQLQINAGETLFFGTNDSGPTATGKQIVAQVYQYDI